MSEAMSTKELDYLAERISFYLNPDALMTRGEVAKELRKSPAEVNNMIADGLPLIHFSERSNYIKRKDLYAYLETKKI